MLGMLDAKAAVARSILISDLPVDFQDAKVRLIANGVNHDLQTGLIRTLRPSEHDAFGKHLIEEQAARVGRVVVRLEEKRGGRAEAAISEPLEAAYTEQVAAKRGAHAGFGEDFPRNNGANRVNAGLKFALFHHVLVK